MAARKVRLAIRGPSSPDLGQERPSDRLRPSALLDLGIRDDALTMGTALPSEGSATRR